MIKVIVGCIVVKDNSFVIVQEAKKHVYGLWNLPAGRLEENEDIITGAKREAEEETGLKLNVDGFVGVYQSKKESGDNIIRILFKASVKSGKIKFPKEEILDCKWISFEEFEKFPVEKIRTKYVIDAVNDYKSRGALPLETVRSLEF
jgi:ADP-ribose pyrophosphatase YjhB (NUDIX family)